jgi:hypothetical protein
MISNRPDELTKADKLERRRPLHLEVAIHAMCPTPLATLRSSWQEFLDSNSPLPLKDAHIDVPSLPDHLQKSCSRALIDSENTLILPTDTLTVHTFILSEEEVSTEELEPTGGDDEWTAGCDSLPLPHKSIDGLWESLIFEPSIKRNLLEYAQSALLFSDMAVSSHIVNWNRILLLYGPPGTGKTSLCRALAHKLAIRMGHRFSGGATLLEIHSHSLFSKWFSTSGKLVSTLFQLVREMVQDDPSTLVCVLIDEVESLASARGNSSGDPSDAMRAVNSLLTSLDRLRTFSNVIVLATTNLTGSVDAAFVDRVDLKIHIGMPILEARYEILRSCLNELVRVGIVTSNNGCCTPFPYFKEAHHQDFTSKLMSCAEQAEGLSGRSLRRLPLQAHAQFMHGADVVSMNDFLDGLLLAIEGEHSASKTMSGGTKK